mgnify:CR=1 FL=1
MVSKTFDEFLFALIFGVIASIIVFILYVFNCIALEYLGTIVLLMFFFYCFLGFLLIREKNT